MTRSATPGETDPDAALRAELVNAMEAHEEGRRGGAYPHLGQMNDIVRFVDWLVDWLEKFAPSALAATASPGRPGILDDSIEGNVQRVDAIRVLELALASQGVPDVNAPSLLRDIEEGGYTLRLTTSDERRRRNDR